MAVTRSSDPALSMSACRATWAQFPKDPAGVIDGDDADVGAHDAAVEVVGGNVDASVKAGDASLVGCVTVGRPLQRHRLGGAGLVEESAGFDRVGGEPAGEVGRARQFGQDFGRGATETRVSADVAGKRRTDERCPLIRHPVGGANPSDSAGHRARA